MKSLSAAPGLALLGAALAAVSLGACSRKPAATASSAPPAAAPASPVPASSAAPAQDRLGPVIPASDIPNIRAGYWMRVDTAPGRPPHRYKACESGGKPTIRLSRECPNFTIHRTLFGHYVVDGDCAFRGASMTLHAEAQGDFQTSFTSDSTMHIQMPGRPAIAETHHFEGRYLGPCPPGAAANDAG